MEITEIIKLAKEYESLTKSASYTRHFLGQVESEGSELTVLSGGAELDVHYEYRLEFLGHIQAYLESVEERVLEIKDLLEDNYGETVPDPV